MTADELLLEIHGLQDETLVFERKYGLRSDLHYAAYMRGEEPEDDSWVMDFGEWAGIYKLLLKRQVQYRNEVERLMHSKKSYYDLVQVAE